MVFGNYYPNLIPMKTITILVVACLTLFIVLFTLVTILFIRF